MTDADDTVVLDQAQNIVVMAGAGLSTASGIPDFRSEQNNILFWMFFSRLLSGPQVQESTPICKNIIFPTQRRSSNLTTLGEHFWLWTPPKNNDSLKRQNPRAFNTWAKEFFPGENYLPNTAHYFLKVLQDKEKLSKYFTQNIDGLEKLAGSSQLWVFDVF